MPIASSQIVMERPENNNTLRVRERHILHDGTFQHVSYVLSLAEFDYLVEPDRTVAIQNLIQEKLAGNAARLADNLKRAEASKYVSEIQEGKNPFRDAQNNPVDPVEHTRTELLAIVLHEVCSTDDPLLFMAGAPYLGNLSDAELIGLLSIDQTVVDDIRSKAASMQDIATFKSNFVAPIGGE